MDQAKLKGYTPVIGIECHVQLKTKTKLFAAVDVAPFESEPNTAITQICLGMPGALPVLNEQAVKLAARAAYTLNTKPQPFSKFDRKHYFYPDLPKGYQISQFEEPIIVGGHIDIKVDGKSKRVNITRAHLEEDAGKTIHPPGKDYSLVDLNRAGTPLLEIVSEPDMHSAEEARVYAHELYLLMRYAEVSDADLYQGNMRFDVNVSVSKDENELGTRTETKNLNSFKSVEKAVEYEVKRQIEVLEKGERIIQETRGWNDAKQKTFSQRSKEDAHDYRYFPDADIPPLDLSQAFIDSAIEGMPILPGELRTKLSGLNIDESAIETLVEEIVAGKFALNILASSGNDIAKRIANWLTSDVQGLIAEGELTWDEVKLDDKAFVSLAEMTLQNKVSSTNAKVILLEIVKNGGSPDEIANSMNLLQVSDEADLKNIVRQVLADNPQAAEDLRNGQDKAIGFLVGQVMKLSKGQANPQVSQKLIRELTSE
jgi:aspartyl-tRNA(Asn)/glutamyl-tRNA(Gln) amidotransferase subunit B